MTSREFAQSPTTREVPSPNLYGEPPQSHPLSDLNQDGICRIHARYGNKARKCVAIACKILTFLGR
ncbi:Hypothetical protein FKW44_006193 [Caligus rogercresseyi]|uniref:Uncharacterized protein n=1 Tax=Caligus rogercresseyi TaxID=217165 RepID=A0A7T8KD09_CALRO|nr:Hypothetical protein FKW44_006193 [Caligus rogercresseyi]